MAGRLETNAHGVNCKKPPQFRQRNQPFRKKPPENMHFGGSLMTLPQLWWFFVIYSGVRHGSAVCNRSACTAPELSGGSDGCSNHHLRRSR
jgi:hypothetical protein